jgi:hypothetical protein
MLRRAWAWSAVVGMAVTGCGSGDDDGGATVDGGPGGGTVDPSCEVDTSLSLEESRALVPFSPGNRWFYRGRAVRGEANTGTGYSSDTVALDPQTVDGEVVQPLRSTAVGYLDRTIDAYHRIDDTGIYSLGNTDDQDTVTPLVVPYLEMKFPIQVCTSFEAFATTSDYDLDLDGDGLNEKADTSSRVWLRGFEDAETSLGVFPGSLRLERTRTTTIRTSMTMEDLTTEEDTVSWFAPGVGLVKSVSTTEDPSRIHEELIGFDVDGEGRGAVLLGKLASDLAELGSDETDVGRPAVACDGTRFLVVVREEISFSSGKLWALVVSSHGVVEDRIDLGVNGQMPVLAFDGANYLLVYEEVGTGIEGLRLSSEGVALGAPFLIAGSAGGPAVAFGGDTFLVAYSKITDPTYLDVFASRVSSEGTVLGETLLSGGPAAQTSPSVDFDGDRFFVIWQDARNDPMEGTDSDIYGTRVSIQGQVIDPDGIAVATGPAPELVPDVAFDGSNHVVAWFEARIINFIGDGDIRGARVGSDGALLDGPASGGGFAISTNPLSKNHPRVSRFDPGVVVVWEAPGFDNERPAGVLGARLDADGQLVHTVATGEGLWLSGVAPAETTSQFRFPAIASAQDRALLTWVDNVEGAGTKSLQASMLFPW